MARILLAEDDASARSLLAHALRADGHAVVEMEDGQSALACLLADPSAMDLIISDVEMPGMDGVTLAERARAARPDLNVLLISGYPEGLARAGLLSGDLVRCLSKPATLEAVRAEVRAIIG